MTRDQEALARRTLVELRGSVDNAARIAAVLRRAAAAVDGKVDRVGERVRLRGRWPGTTVRHGTRFGQGRTRIEVRSGPLRTERCAIELGMRPQGDACGPIADVAATMRAMAILLEGGAGRPGAEDDRAFRLVSALCAMRPDRPDCLPVLHSGTPFDPPHVHDEGPRGPRTAVATADAATAMERLPPRCVVEMAEPDPAAPRAITPFGGRRPWWRDATIHAHADRSEENLDAVGVLRLLADVDGWLAR